MKFGFIGCGNMGQAMIGGMLKSGKFKSEEIIVSAATDETLEKARESYHVATTKDNKEVAKQAKHIVLAVKPHQYEGVLEEMKGVVSKDSIIISIAPGQQLKDLEMNVAQGTKVALAMPNTPVMVGEGMVAICTNEYVTEGELYEIQDAFTSFGKVALVDERLMDAVVAVSGSSPAYVFIFIEAMADAAVLKGIPRKQAYTFAAQAVLGAAKMVLETGIHPAELKDRVCSPGGTTIEAVKILEQTGFRGSIIEAMIACADKIGKLE